MSPSPAPLVPLESRQTAPDTGSTVVVLASTDSSNSWTVLMLDVRIVDGGSLRNVERIISSDPSHEQTSSVFCDRWLVFGGALRRLLGAVSSSLMYPKDVELIIPFAWPQAD
jgi:hypothetical protein